MNAATDCLAVVREIAQTSLDGFTNADDPLSTSQRMRAMCEIESEGAMPKLYDVRLTPDELGHVLSLLLQFGIANPPGSRFHYAENTSAMQKLNNAVVAR